MEKVAEMDKRSDTAIMLFLTVSLIFVPCVTVKASSAKTINVPNNYPTISAAIGNASDGDTIMVKNGVYIEQTLQINKSLNIIRQNIGGAQIILHPPEYQQNFLGGNISVYASPIVINASNAKLSDFKIHSDDGNIEADGNNIQLSNNVITGGGGNAIALSLNGDGPR